MKTEHETDIYKKAKRRMKELKDFYGHAAVYLLVNTLIVMFVLIHNNQGGEIPLWMLFGPLGGWGIGLAIHAWCTFGPRILFNSNWEHRKTMELMKAEEQEYEKLKHLK